MHNYLSICKSVFNNVEMHKKTRKRMQKLHQMRISSISKEKLEQIKNKERFSTFSSAIETMCAFFEKNNISPKEGVIQSYQNSVFEVKNSVNMGLFELKKQYNQDSQSMRKLLRSIERDYMISATKKISFLYEKEKEKAVKSNNEIEFSALIKNTKNTIENGGEIPSVILKKKEDEIQILKSIILDKNEQINTLNNYQDSAQINSHKYEETMKVIFDKYRIQKSTLGKEKIIIDMNKDDFEKLFMV